MWFIVIGVLLIAMKLADFGPVAAWSWWWVLAPFALAAAWWAYADSSGYTRRREMDKLDERKLERRRKAMEALGIDRQRQKSDEAAMRARRAAAERVESTRAVKREHNEKVIRDSVFESGMSSSFDDDVKTDPDAKKKR
jgi:small Trp-rich protein